MTLAATLGPDGLIYALGGFNSIGLSPTSVVEAYNPVTNSWTTKASLPTANATLAAALGADGLIYAFGGYGSSSTPSTVDGYDAVSNTWTSEASMPTAREALAAVSDPNGLIYAFGGLGSNGILSTVEGYLFRAALSGTGSHSINVSGSVVKPLPNPDRVGVFHGDGTWTLDLSGNGSNPVTFLFA